MKNSPHIVSILFFFRTIFLISIYVFLKKNILIPHSCDTKELIVRLYTVDLINSSLTHPSLSEI